MFTQVVAVKVYYEQGGHGKPVLLLHGWGGNSASFKPVFNHLCSQFKVYSPDLPGFGRTSLPPQPWETYDYVHFIVELLAQLEIKKTHIIAHSFGGRIAIILAAEFPALVEKIVLVDSAGIKPKRGVKVWGKIAFAKLLKRLKRLFPGLLGKKLERLYSQLGSEDYRQAGKMRATLVKVLRDDLSSLLGKITAPTLLIWGEKDPHTPLYQAKIMNKAIKNSRLVVLKGCGHFSYLEKLPHFCQLVSRFLEETK